MGILDFFGFGKKSNKEVVIPKALVGEKGFTPMATSMSHRKGHTGQFTKAVEKRRIANRVARLSRRKNRKSKFKKHVY